ncbi:hypothetical protein HPC49_36955 [Pyxidicoccus fallax]|uniref:Uncharacterized protein n=1 Tax=Pyxidicoccus fallax TaxID=394095 RepID=A0A848LVX4_9BACT|nr:hypothetical protein [Pyxidicoccus fallax]NMO22175.1 hypothetical protein [Pyxidicoccus fallax]NPC83796.1 hypothetical protein [Pyxidicoccus fallax]
MRPNLFAGLLLVSLCGTGCEPYPDSPLFIYGLALRGDGSPFGDTELSLEGGRAPSVFGPLDFTPYGMTKTHANGAFALEILAGDILPRMEGEDTRLRPNFRERFRVATPVENGRATFASFTLATGGGDSEIPVMRLWDANLAWADAPTGRALTFAPIPPTPEAPQGVVVSVDEPQEEEGVGLEDPLIPLSTLQVHGQEGLVWQEHGVASPWALAPWLVEDAAAEAQVRVVSAGAWNRYPLTSPEAWLYFRLEWRSERLPVPTGSLRPISRGAACHPALDAPCPFTDGHFAERKPHELWPQAPGTPVLPVGVSLDAPARLSRVVVRNLVTSGHVLVIEGSEDGTQWTELARRTLTEQDGETGNSRGFRRESQADSPWDPPLQNRGRYFLDIPLSGSPTVRHVRIVPMWRGTSAMVVNSLSELSLFE